MSDYIPNDLLIEVLARLPVNSLIRFKSVCKSWYSLITSPIFINKQLNHSKTNTDELLIRLYTATDKKEHYLLFHDDEKFGDEYSELEFPFRIKFGYFRIVGSCNGLLCLCDDYFRDSPDIILWNPSIRKSVTLPIPYKPQCPHMFVLGFGAHPTTHEYKVFMKGAVHWVANDPCVDVGYRNLVMSFDMGEETFYEMMLPLTLAEQNPTSLSVKLFGESLAVLCRGQRDSGCCCIWVMKEYRVVESWTKLFNINLPGMFDRTSGFRKNGEVLLSTSNNCLLSFDARTKKIINTGIRGSPHAFYVEPFIDTLLLGEKEDGPLQGASDFQERW
ncbi:F-box protein At5g18160-like [Actinidia eriantha]|uniref:F-box protein At5g18160-like n=1 Tax=Actinidia eriantha TaxID=165200 RepID=UPI00258975E7|nr:F-box protein At5g18160-like [Actinidia eriantha]